MANRFGLYCADTDGVKNMGDGFKWSSWVLSSRASSEVQTVGETCANFNVARLAVNLVQSTR